MLSVLALPCLLGFALSAPVNDYSTDVQDVVSFADNYIKDHILTDVKLPNIGGYLPTDIVELSDGKLGAFDTMKVLGSPVVSARPNSDGSVTYLFDLSLGLQQLSLQYQFDVKLFGVQNKYGSVTISPTENSVRAKGLVLIKKDRTCEADLRSLAVTSFSNYVIEVTPINIPQLQLITETILNFVSPKLIPVSNVALQGVIFAPGFQHIFSEIVCEVLNQPTAAPTEAPKEPSSEAPKEPSSEAPKEPSSEPPKEPSSEPPKEPSSEAPKEPSSEAPKEPSSEAPKEPSSEAPEEPSSEAPKEPSSEAPKEPSSEAPKEPSSEAPPKAST